MVFDVRFYNPTNIYLGGAINTSELLGDLVATSQQTVPAAEFFTVTSDVSGGSTNRYHRKVWLRNHDVDTIQAPEIWMSDLEYPSQITIAREKSSNDTTTDPYTAPSGYTDSDFIAATAIEDRIALYLDTSDMSANETAAVWIRASVPAGHVADAAALGRLRLRGTRI